MMKTLCRVHLLSFVLAAAAATTTTLLFSREGLTREWETHNPSLKATVGKIRSKENSIEEFIQLKKITVEQAKMSEILSKITTEHKELITLYDDFEKEKQHIRFEHPEEGPRVERQYRPLRLKTLDEFETEGGIDGKLNELKAKVKKKYGDPAPENAPITPPNAAQIKKDEQAEKEKKRIKLIY